MSTLSASPQWALQRAVAVALASDAAIKAILGDPARIYDEPPEDRIFPYLTFGRWESTPLIEEASLGPPGPLRHTGHLHIWSRYLGRREVLDIADAVRAVIDAQSAAPDGRVLVAMRTTYTDVFRLTDGRTSRANVRLRAVTEPLPAS